MNIATLSASYLRARPMHTILGLALLSLGVCAITLLILVVGQIEDRMGRDARGIDLVVGAKGSPLQLILSGIYHLDAPTGNMPLKAAKALAQDPRVARAIPLALGDSFRGFRIVGSGHEYPALYGARIAGGRLWQEPMEAVLGSEVAARTGMGLGAAIVAAHGIGADSDTAHGSQPYRVVGVLAPTGSVLDRLVLTSVESVWQIHEEHHEPADDAERQALAEEREITVLLVQYASPLAAVSLPRQINSRTEFQAASPAYETARLFRIVGFGVEALRALAVLLVLAAGFSVFVALYNALEERRYQLAVMRVLGAAPRRIFGLLMLEGTLLSLVGTLAGLALGHGLVAVSAGLLAVEGQSVVSAAVWRDEEWWLAAFGVSIGAIAALVPAWRASRADVARILSEA